MQGNGLVPHLCIHLVTGDLHVLTFVGLGLYDLQDISVKGLECIQNADAVYLESYTSRLFGCTLNQMQELYGKEIRVLSRHDIEGDPDPLLNVQENEVVLLMGETPWYRQPISTFVSGLTRRGSGRR